MEKTISVLNGMVKDGVIARYAIGGAMAAMFYTEPIATYDLDVFVSLPQAQGPVVSMKPLYDHLRARGYSPDREHIQIEGIPVQFLPAYNPLVEEAVERALTRAYGARKTWVIGPEYLLAIMLQTGRRKDMARIAQFLDEVPIGRARFRDILSRHQLTKRWKDAFGGLDG